MKLIIMICFILVALLVQKDMVSVKNAVAIYGIMIAMLIYSMNSMEGFASSSEESDTEAVANLASMFADGTLIADNVELSDDLTVGGTLNAADVALTGSLTGTDVALSGGLTINGNGMQLVKMLVGDNSNTKIVDSDGNAYAADEWVCGIMGKNLDWNNTDPGRIEAYCYTSSGYWYIHSEIENAGDGGNYYIIAIPVGYFNRIDQTGAINYSS
jgi:hypothetical protein